MRSCRTFTNRVQGKNLSLHTRCGACTIGRILIEKPAEEGIMRYMTQIISLPQPVFEELVGRIRRLESAVFGKKKEQFPAEYVKLSLCAKKRYQKIDEDIKKGKNIYSFNNPDDALSFLLSDKRKK